QIRVAARVERGLQLQDHLVGGDDLLALEVPAALRRDLVLDQDAGRPGALELAHRADDVVQVAVPRVAVGDDGDGDALGHAAHGGGNFGQGDQADVGQAEQAGGRAEAADEDGLQPGGLDEAGREDVVGPEAADDAGGVEQLAQAAGGGLHGDDLS